MSDLNNTLAFVFGFLCMLVMFGGIALKLRKFPPLGYVAVWAVGTTLLFGAAVTLAIMQPFDPEVYVSWENSLRTFWLGTSLVPIVWALIGGLGIFIDNLVSRGKVE